MKFRNREMRLARLIELCPLSSHQARLKKNGPLLEEDEKAILADYQHHTETTHYLITFQSFILSPRDSSGADNGRRFIPIIGAFNSKSSTLRTHV